MVSTGGRPLGFIYAVDSCLRPAHHTGHTTIRITHHRRHEAADAERLTFELKFCDEHAAAVGNGGILVVLDGDRDNRGV